MFNGCENILFPIQGAFYQVEFVAGLSLEQILPPIWAGPLPWFLLKLIKAWPSYSNGIHGFFFNHIFDWNPSGHYSPRTLSSLIRGVSCTLGNCEGFLKLSLARLKRSPEPLQTDWLTGLPVSSLKHDEWNNSIWSCQSLIEVDHLSVILQRKSKLKVKKDSTF
jgi:hypothetical protein